MNSVVCNASPIIGLSKLGRLDLLWKLFGEIIIPDAVFEEVVQGIEDGVGAFELEKALKEGHIKKQQVSNNIRVDQLYGRLHKGELEVMVLAKELSIKHVLLDDRSARSFANSMMLKTKGLGGILVDAKKQGEIESVKDCLDILIQGGYRMSVKVYNQLLQKADEV